MNGIGCKNCPVKPCETMNYRGSVCSERARLGLGDPMTNADRIRADMDTDEELAGYLIECCDDWGYYHAPDGVFYDTYKEALVATIKWLKQPAEVE